MTTSPGHFADRPATPDDPPAAAAEPRDPADTALGLDVGGHTDDLLSDLLHSVRLSGERIDVYAPPPTFSIGFTGTGSLHIVEAGEVTVRIDGDQRVYRLCRGDAVLLPRGDTHRVTDTGEPARPTRCADETGDGTAGPARWLCGTFTIGDPRASHLLESLPAAIILRCDSDPSLEGLEVARKMLEVEMRSPSQGSAVMVARILDLVFIQILRAWAAGPDAEPNWLAGALDPHTGPALSAIHRDPGHDWTVDELARECNISRSVFAARFVAHVGTPPAAYLTNVRMDAAVNLLRETDLPVTLIGRKVGYTSDAAFSRAFKNRHGTSPDHWRRGHQGTIAPQPAR